MKALDAPPREARCGRRSIRRHGSTAGRVGLLLLLCGLISACPSKPAARSASLPRRVAHALGGIDGKTYVNAPEAFIANYAKGCRAFEVDLWLLNSGDIVALHGAGERQRAGLPRPFTVEQYLQVKPYGVYSPMLLDGLAELAAKHPDATFVSDMRGTADSKAEVPLNQHTKVMRSGHEKLCASLTERGMDCAARVVPQAYTFEDVLLLEEMGFDRIILTVYRLREVSDEAVASFVAERPSVVAVTMPHGRFTKMPLPTRELFARSGVRLYVHTVNGKKMTKMLESGAGGVYTDFDCVGE